MEGFTDQSLEIIPITCMYILLTDRISYLIKNKQIDNYHT